MVEEPTFAEMAEELLAWVCHEAALTAFAEPFMAGIPVSAPGMQHAYAQMQRRLVVFAAAAKLLGMMAPQEARHREVMAHPEWEPAPATH